MLDRDLVAHQKTLEQKISDQGPPNQHVDPHLLGLAIVDLLELNRLRDYKHSGFSAWYANPGTSAERVTERLTDLGPLYASVSGAGFGNLTGDALEVVVFKALDRIFRSNPRFAYQGYFHLDQPKTVHGRYQKTQPPKTIGNRTTAKEADFLQFGHSAGPLCIECKNYREWIYPHHHVISELIIKAAELGALPVLICRRFHYTTLRNFLEPAGIIAHQSLYQYYPKDQIELANRVKHARSLGFTDVTATEEPHPRTVQFFEQFMPSIVDRMAIRWNANKDELLEYAQGQLNLAQVYTAIDSPVGGKWQDFDIV